MTGWQVVAYGTPAPQGSKSFRGRGATGKGILVESSKAVKPWREDVKQAGLAARQAGAPCLDGPIAVRMVFTLARPKSAPKRRRHPDTTPDLSKLARSTEDAITTAGLWADDARVVDYYRLAKVWAGYDEEALPMPGVILLACEAAGGCTGLLMGGAELARAERQRFDRVVGS
ncbi:MAG: RusA family crossover junction endodeoxyribonuclease [Acidimicrobiales bacterium]